MLTPRTAFFRVVAVVAVGVLAPTARADVEGSLARAEQDLKSIDDGLQLVENAYAYRPEPPEQEQLGKRYSDAEIQFLLGNYQPASVLLYDLIGSPAFKSSDHYADAM